MIARRWVRRAGVRSAVAALAAVTLGMSPMTVPQPSSAPAGPDTKVIAPKRGVVHTPTNRPELTIRGTASGRRIKRVRIAVRDVRTKKWLQDNGRFGAAKDWRRAKGKRKWRAHVVLPKGRYVVIARSKARGRVGTAPSRTRFTVGARDPLRWPYPSDSFWNMPRGKSARLVPFGMHPPEKTLRAEEDLLYLAPGLPKSQWTTLSPHEGGWRGDRCDADWSKAVKLGDNWTFPMPDLVPGEQSGSFPNHSTAIVMPDYTLRETQPLAFCEEGIASQHAALPWQGDSLITGGRGADFSTSPPRGGGSHGGSFMTAMGGTIRLGEWVRGGNIPHATKIDVYSQMWLTQEGRFPGYRWPALRADAGWATDGGGYGSLAPQGGSSRPDDAVMGALLTLPNSFDVSRLRSEPARILARSILQYGTYIVDGTGRPTVAFATEWSSRGRVLDEFERAFGFSPVGDYDARPAYARSAKNQFLNDLRFIYRNLHIVADNAPRNVGGAGARMTFKAPPL